MATKLKNLKVTKVDFVDEGANPDAHIRLFKRRDGDPEPAAEPPADGKTEPEKNTKLWGRVFGAIAKAFSNSESMEGAVEEIQKGDAATFGQKMERRKLDITSNEIWDLCNALQSSLCSILYDDEIDRAGKQASMKVSLEEFNSVIGEAIPRWALGESSQIVAKSGDPMTETEIGIAKRARDRLDEMIRNAVGEDKDDPDNGEKEPDDKDGGIKKTKGETKDMKIDKSKLTEAEKAFLESIEKRYGEEDPAGGAPDPTPAPADPAEPGGEGVKKGAQSPGTAPSPAPAVPPAAGTDGADDIYKGLHPAVRAEMEALRKFREDAENRELAEVAKKYAIIGKKEEDLVPVLKNLKAAGGSAYDDMIAVLDNAVDMVEKSGLFSEIGKRGNGDASGSAWAQAEAKTTEVMKSKPGLTKAQAMDEVFQADPELAKRCEEEG